MTNAHEASVYWTFRILTSDVSHCLATSYRKFCHTPRTDLKRVEQKEEHVTLCYCSVRCEIELCTVDTPGGVNMTHKTGVTSETNPSRYARNTAIVEPLFGSKKQRLSGSGSLLIVSFRHLLPRLFKVEGRGQAAWSGLLHWSCHLRFREKSKIPLDNFRSVHVQLLPIHLVLTCIPRLDRQSGSSQAFLQTAKSTD